MKNFINQLNYEERTVVLQNLKEQSKSYKSFSRKIIYLKVLLILAIAFINIFFLKNLKFMFQLAIMTSIYTLLSYLIDRFLVAPRVNAELNNGEGKN